MTLRPRMPRSSHVDPAEQSGQPEYDENRPGRHRHPSARGLRRAEPSCRRCMKPARLAPLLLKLRELPMSPLETAVLPSDIRARFVDDINGLRVHILEAGFDGSDRPLVLLLHGFPEIAYSWRKVMPALAASGYHVVAPDQRGYGRTTGWSADYDDDLRPFRTLNAVRDALGLLAALGRRSIHAVVGNDFGAGIAA